MMTLLARTKFYGNGAPLSGLDPARLGARGQGDRGSAAPRSAAGPTP
jgi:preprotein translocase subunit SecD